MRAKVISKPGLDVGEPSVRGVGGEMHKPLKGDPNLLASESGINIKEFGERVLKNQSSELPNMFKAARVRNALQKQGYKEEDISTALKEMGVG